MVDDSSIKEGRLARFDWQLGLGIGVASFFIYLIFTAPGLDPSLWEDAAVAASLRPARLVTAGLWRVLLSCLMSLFGCALAVKFLSFLGALAGGAMMALVYFIIRRVFAILTRLNDFKYWNRLSPFFAVAATVAFGTSDAMARMIQPLTPGGIQFLVVLSCVYLLLCWFYRGGQEYLLIVTGVTGLLTADTPFGLLLPPLCYFGYLGIMKAIAAGNFESVGTLPGLRSYPRWQVFFSFLFALIIGITFNILSFGAFDGIAATGWDGFDLLFRYVISLYGALVTAASPVGWFLAFALVILPFAGVLMLFPRLARDGEPMAFRLGLLMFFLGAFLLMQCGFVPLLRLCDFAVGIVEIRSDLLLAILTLLTVLGAAMAGVTLANAAQYHYDFNADEDDDTGFAVSEQMNPVFKWAAPVIMAIGVFPGLFCLVNPTEKEARQLVDDALAETVRECDGVDYLFTDGRLDAGLELKAHALGSSVKPLNMMSGPTHWEKYLRTRLFSDEHIRDTAAIGIPALLRVWAGETTNGMDCAAIQLGFEFWQRARRPSPRLSGLVAREKGIDDVEAERGASAAKALAERTIELSKKLSPHSISPATKFAVSSVSWRLSRFARLRNEDSVANELDEWNETVKHMMELLNEERQRVFSQMTPYEGLRLALLRAEFSEARRYGATVLAIDQDDPDANFGTGMAYLMEDKLKEAEFYLDRVLKRRPEEPAVLNNLAIIYRKTNRIEKSLEFAQKAHERLPDNEEIKKTLESTKKAIEARKDVFKNAFSR